MIQKHSFITEVLPTDWRAGDGNIVFGSVVPNAIWTPYFHFLERQKFTFDSDGCEVFGTQEIIDAQIDYFIQSGKIGQDIISHLTALGFMDSASDDGKPHFHSSESFPQALTGNGQNGNPARAACDVARKYGLLPWADRPFTDQTTLQELLAPPTQAQLDKAKQVLQYFTFPYHWIVDGVLPGTAVSKMKNALLQAPLLIGIPICEPWDQANPPTCPLTEAVHMVAVTEMDTATKVLDHYEPFFKSLQFSYNVPYCFQVVVTPVPQIPNDPPQPPAIINKPPTSDDKQATLGWLDVVAQWLHNWLSLNPKGRPNFGSDPQMNTATNVGLQTVATGLVALGATSIASNLVAGVVEILLGIAVYAVYELIPSK
jgi:hypothetical protein